MKCSGVVMVLMGCLAMGVTSHAQPFTLARPTVLDKACALAYPGIAIAVPHAAQPGSNASPNSDSGNAGGSLSAQEKLICYARISYYPTSFVWPGISAAKKMIFPPQAYPADWRQGFRGFGRNYGDAIANDTANRGARYVSAIAFHEDTRYWPSESKWYFLRFLQSVTFALVDRSDSGKWMPAFSNLTGAAAGGFVGNAYLPAGYNNVTHAGQRAAVQLAESPLPNLFCEFTPELRTALGKMRLRNNVVGFLNTHLLSKCAR